MIIISGGRGIGNAVETYLINPLSGHMFDNHENKVNSVVIKKRKSRG